jgi:hypothetical protein
VDDRRAILAKHPLQFFAISNHLVGQAVCDDPIDERHKGILRARVWGDGSPEGVRQRAAESCRHGGGAEPRRSAPLSGVALLLSARAARARPTGAAFGPCQPASCWRGPAPAGVPAGLWPPDRRRPSGSPAPERGLSAGAAYGIEPLVRVELVGSGGTVGVVTGS